MASSTERWEVVKVNMFGVHQPRLMEVDRGLGGEGGVVRILKPGKGGKDAKEKRALDPSRVIGVEGVRHLKARENARGVTLRFVDLGLEAKRTLLFPSSVSRDAFVVALTEACPDATVRGLGALDSDGGGAGKRKSTGSRRGITGSIGEEDDEAEGLGGSHVVSLENAYGFQVRRITQISGSRLFVRLTEAERLRVAKADAAAAGAGKRAAGSRPGDMELSLTGLRVAAPHAVEPSALWLSFVSGSTKVDLVMYFRSPEARELFLEALRAAWESIAHTRVKAGSGDGEDGGPKFPWERKWRSPLPTSQWGRFEVTKAFQLRQRHVLMVSPRKRVIYIIRSSDLEAIGAGESDVIPSDAPISEIIGVMPGRLNVEKVAANPLRLHVSAYGPGAPYARRSHITFDFTSTGERERCCAWLNALAASPHGDDTATVSSLARSVAHNPPEIDPAALWSKGWPHDDVRLWIGTFNVSSQPPRDSGELSRWLPFTFIEQRDLVVVALQEIGPTTNRESWGSALLAHLNTERRTRAATVSGGKREGGVGGGIVPRNVEDQFQLVAHTFMWEMGLWVFVRCAHAPDITHVVSSCEPTGIGLAKKVTGKQLGNKGGVGIALRWREVPMCFVAVHLAARPERIVERERDFTQIVRRLQLDTTDAATGLDFVHQHEHTFFLGDLNYRVTLPFEEAVKAHRAGDFVRLRQHDQLRVQKGMRRVLDGFHEGKIDFGPTYRWARDRDEFSNKRAQSPSYTDRVLHRSAPGVAWCLRQDDYSAALDLFGSDHRPVSASYTLALRQYYTISAPLSVHTRLPAPAYFAQEDHGTVPVPVLVFSDLTVMGYQAIMAPRSMYLVFSGGALEDAPYVTPAVAAGGEGAMQFEALDSLLKELKKEASERRKEAKKEAKRAKHEAKLEAKRLKKEAKQRGTTPSPSSPSGSGSAAAPSPSSSSTASLYFMGAESDSDDSTDDEMEGGEGRDGRESIAAEDIEEAEQTETSEVLAWLTVQSVGAGDSSSSVTPARARLLAQTCSYDQTSRDALPPLRLHQWDPRLLRTGHVAIAAHEPRSLGAEVSRPKVVGQTLLPLAPLCDAAAKAASSGLREAIARKGDDFGKASDGSYRRSVLRADLYRASMDNDGIPWALHGEPVPFVIDVFRAGQPVAKLGGNVALRASNDRSLKAPSLIGAAAFEFAAEADELAQFHRTPEALAVAEDDDVISQSEAAEFAEKAVRAAAGDDEYDEEYDDETSSRGLATPTGSSTPMRDFLDEDEDGGSTPKGLERRSDGTLGIPEGEAERLVQERLHAMGDRDSGSGRDSDEFPTGHSSPPVAPPHPSPPPAPYPSPPPPPTPALPGPPPPPPSSATSTPPPPPIGTEAGGGIIRKQRRSTAPPKSFMQQKLAQLQARAQSGGGASILDEMDEDEEDLSGDEETDFEDATDPSSSTGPTTLLPSSKPPAPSSMSSVPPPPALPGGFVIPPPPPVASGSEAPPPPPPTQTSTVKHSSKPPAPTIPGPPPSSSTPQPTIPPARSPVSSEPSRTTTGTQQREARRRARVRLRGAAVPGRARKQKARSSVMMQSAPLANEWMAELAETLEQAPPPPSPSTTTKVPPPPTSTTSTTKPPPPPPSSTSTSTAAVGSSSGGGVGEEEDEAPAPLPTRIKPIKQKRGSRRVSMFLRGGVASKAKPAVPVTLLGAPIASSKPPAPLAPPTTSTTSSKPPAPLSPATTSTTKPPAPKSNSKPPAPISSSSKPPAPPIPSPPPPSSTPSKPPAPLPPPPAPAASSLPPPPPSSTPTIPAPPPPSSVSTPPPPPSPPSAESSPTGGAGKGSRRARVTLKGRRG